MLKVTFKLVYVENAVILSKIFFRLQNSHAHLKYAYNICAKFQIDCLKTRGGVDYTNFSVFKGATDGQTDGQMDRGKT